MAGQPRRFIEVVPAPVVGFDFGGQGLYERRNAHFRDKGLEGRDPDVIDHGILRERPWTSRSSKPAYRPVAISRKPPIRPIQPMAWPKWQQWLPLWAV